MKLLLLEIVAGLLCGLCVAQDPTTPVPNNSTPQTQQAPENPAKPSQPSAQPAPAQTPAQTQDQAPTQTQTQAKEQSRRIAPGSVIPVQLSKTVDAKKAKVGDEVDAKVTQDMKAVNGDVVVAKDTKVVGHVTEAQARTKDQKGSQVGIAFDKAEMKDGSVSLPMSIQAVIAPQNPNGENAAPSGGGAPPPNPNNAPSGNNSSRMGGTAPQPSTPSYPSSGQPTATADTGGARPPITANTQGIVGIPNYELSTPGDQTHSSVVRSEKSNVKLESGTLLLLRVNQ